MSAEKMMVKKDTGFVGNPSRSDKIKRTAVCQSDG
jgi:hypothetical protein